VKRKLGLLLATFAIALHALWPLIAQAKPKSVALVPVCTIGGETHYTEVPLGKSPAEERSASHFEHCSLCTLGGAFLPSGFPVPAQQRGSHVLPESTGFFVFSQASLRANSRAPPPHRLTA